MGPHKARPPRRTPETPKVTASNPGLGGPHASPKTRVDRMPSGSHRAAPDFKAARGSSGPWPCPSGTSKGRPGGGWREEQRAPGTLIQRECPGAPSPTRAPGHPHPGGSPRGSSPNRRHLQQRQGVEGGLRGPQGTPGHLVTTRLHGGPGAPPGPGQGQHRYQLAPLSSPQGLRVRGWHILGSRGRGCPRGWPGGTQEACEPLAPFLGGWAVGPGSAALGLLEGSGQVLGRRPGQVCQPPRSPTSTGRAGLALASGRR